MKNLLFLLLIFSAPFFPQETVDIIWEADAKARTVTFTKDGLTMYTGGLEIENPYSYGNVKKWDVNTKSMLFNITSAGSNLLGLTNDIAVSPTGSMVATGHGALYCVPPSGGCYNVLNDFFILNSGGTANFYPQGLDGIVTGVSFSYDGSYAAMGMRRTLSPQINVYRTNDYQLNNSFTVNNTGSYALAFSPVQNILASGMFEGHINLYNIETNQIITTIQHGNYTQGGYPVSLAFSPDGSLLASASDGYNTKIRVWNTQTHSPVYTFEGVYNGSADAAFSPNGEYLAAGFREYVFGGGGWRGIIRIWRLSDGQLVKEYLDPSASGNGAGVTSIAFSAIGENWFAYTYNDKIKFAETDLIFNTVVPVELISFTGKEINNSIVLEWETAGEINNRGFEVERSKAGEELLDIIGFVEGNGSTSEKQSYRFIDENPAEGTSVYRLRQIDFDGTYEYSIPVEVDFTSLQEFALHQNFPNPFNPSTKIRYSVPEAGNVQLKIFDVLGNEVAALVNENKAPGSYEIEFNGEGLTSGLYIYQVKAGKYIESKKMTLMK